MKFILKKLEIQGYKPFDKKQTFCFPENSGFYFVSGKNYVNPELEGNCAEKSSLWSALCWVFFERTTRNVRARNVKNWHGSEKCRVDCEFDLDEDSYHLMRTWSPNQLKISKNTQDQEDITQDELESLIRMNMNLFLHSVLVSQFRPMFFDLKPEERTKLFSDLLKLQDWIELSDKTKNKVKDLQESIHSLELKRGSIQGEIKGLESQNYTELEKKWEENFREEKLALKKNISEFQENLKESKKEEEILLGDKESLEEESKPLKKKHDSIQKNLDLLIDDKTNLILNSRSQQKHIQDLESQKKRFLSFRKGDKKRCSRCNQIISEDHIKDEVRDIDISLNASIREKESVDKNLSTLEKTEKRLRKKLSSVNTRIQDVKNDLEENFSSLQVIRFRKESITGDLDRVERKLNKLKEEVNPYKKKKQEIKVKISEFQEKIEDFKVQIKSLEQSIRDTEFWIKGFKRVRLFLIEEALHELTIEVNSYLDQLGLSDWSIEFTIDAPNKSGGVSKGFMVLIKSPSNEEAVPWESWSGGESQRLRLAGTFGLSNLMLSRIGIEPNIEIYDEPSTWMSEKGIENLINLLKDRSRSEKKQIWLTDHRNLDSYGGFDGIVTVEKYSNGSVIRQ